MASRVVPASGATTWRSSPSSRLTREDFPTLGRPTTATLMVVLGLSGIVGGQALDHGIQQIAAPLPHGRAHPDRIAEAERVERVLLGARAPGCPAC